MKTKLFDWLLACGKQNVEDLREKVWLAESIHWLSLSLLKQTRDQLVQTSTPKIWHWQPLYPIYWTSGVSQWEQHRHDPSMSLCVRVWPMDLLSNTHLEHEHCKINKQVCPSFCDGRHKTWHNCWVPAKQAARTMTMWVTPRSGMKCFSTGFSHTMGLL